MSERPAEPLAVDLRREQVAMFFDGLPSSVSASLIYGGILTAISLHSEPSRIVVAWYAAVVIVALVRLLMRFAYLARNGLRDDVRWDRWLIVGTVCSAALWGAVAFVFFAPELPTRQVLLALIVGGIGVGSVTVLAPIWPAVMLFNLISISPLGIRFLLQGGELGYTMGVCLLIFLIMVSMNARRLHDTLLQNVRLRLASHERERLLEAARTDAERANRAKSDFLSRMSHELRTPLNAILGFAQLLQWERGEVGDATGRDNADEIYTAGTHLLSLVNELLDLSRIEAGRAELTFEWVDIADAFKECETQIKPIAEKARVGVYFGTIEPLTLIVEVDRTRLHQVLLNLLSNAVKFSEAGGQVRVFADTITSERVRISVSDDGPGIRTDQQAALFQAFSRLPGTEAMAEGSGLGLMISKSLIEMMHGRISFTSEPGRGATFWVELPLVSAGGSTPETNALEATRE